MRKLFCWIRIGVKLVIDTFQMKIKMCLDGWIYLLCGLLEIKIIKCRNDLNYIVYFIFQTVIITIVKPRNLNELKYNCYSVNI
jgi:hypothetical protein